MPATIDLTITNNANSNKFQFRCVAPIGNKKSQGVISIPLVQTSAANNLLFRFFGQQEEVTFVFAIYSDSVDVSDGTGSSGDYGSSVTTISQQIEFLRDYVFTHEFDTTWTLAQSRFYPSASVTGVITDLEFDNPPAGANIITGKISFMRGRLIGA